MDHRCRLSNQQHHPQLPVRKAATAETLREKKKVGEGGKRGSLRKSSAVVDSARKYNLLVFFIFIFLADSTHAYDFLYFLFLLTLSLYLFFARSDCFEGGKGETVSGNFRNGGVGKILNFLCILIMKNLSNSSHSTDFQHFLSIFLPFFNPFCFIISCSLQTFEEKKL
ncbi:hypothetical protein ERO13_D05G316000v2 [Gossypium hirsutum]|uniref:Transmembrane protein n=1 Tax=Gossypium tomentosum TaxID=34277 RepID=A0A5D2L3T6_GOSTO|nr:hypothetical protein ERO13_D05G316000v2 [Gossypium hirsutum]TYH73850.1 hypothetical protein ES332_D05G356900v1 [Gossypium tomentosum]